MLLIDGNSTNQTELLSSMVLLPGHDELTKQKAQQPEGGGASEQFR
jgi:hypothetical protein